MPVHTRRYYFDQPPAWASAFTAWQPERIAPIRRVGYSLKNLARLGLIQADQFAEFSETTGLADFAWRVLWSDTDGLPDDQSIADVLCRADGVLVFIHGWDGSGEVWEDLPARVIQQSPGLVALVPDVNGFGGTPFTHPTPPLNLCDPPALMIALEQWLNLIGLRSPEHIHPRRPFIFIGHSMGAAALFFMNETNWDPFEVGRIASAPALLMNDRARQRFYKTLGAGIHLSAWSDLIHRVTEGFIAPRVIEALAEDASDFVRAEHHRIFRETPEGVIAQTFAAMGELNADLLRDSWPHFHVFLAHRDRLVGLQPTLEMLEELRFSPAQIRIALGDHYFFSIGKNPDMQALNRDLLINEIISLHHDLLYHQATGAKH